jgi:hypothetical protein
MRCWWMILWLATGVVKAQEWYDSHAMSMASADVCSSTGSYLGRNPASILNQKNAMCGINQLMPFGINGLSTNALYYSKRYKNQGYSVEYAQQGIQGYKEHLSAITAGILLNENLSFGVKLISKATKLSEESMQWSYRVELGMVQSFSKKLSAGIHIKVRTSKEVEVFQNTALSMGLCYYVDSKLPIYVSTEMSELGPTRIRTGMEYIIGKALAVRLGWNNKDAALSGGITYLFKNYKFDMSTALHTRLGLSYGAGLALLFPSKKR